MTQDTIERADEVVDRAEFTDGRAVVSYTRTEQALADLRQRYAGMTFDLKTTAGDKAARAARQELVALRTALEAKRKQFKQPALELGRLIDAEAARINGEILKIEAPIDAAIKADEKRRADEKAERDRIEAARLDRHRRAIDEIRAAATGHAAADAATLAEAITAVTALDVSAARYDEFAPAAQQAQADTLDALRRLHAAATEREAEAQRLQVERARLARVEEFQNRLNRLRALPLTVAGKRAEAIATAIESIKALKFDTWAEYAGQAEEARAETLQQMVDAHAAAVESERVAAEQAAQAEQLAAERRRLDEERERQAEAARQQQAALDAQRAEQDLRARADAAFQAAVNRVGYERAAAIRDAYASGGQVLSSDVDDYIAALDALAVPVADPVPFDKPVAVLERGMQYHELKLTDADASFVEAHPVAHEPIVAPAPTVKLGDLCARFGAGFSMTAAFVEQVLGVASTKGERGAHIYTEAQVAEMCKRLAALAESLRADALLRTCGVQG